jgi:hypothetical protein
MTTAPARLANAFRSSRTAGSRSTSLPRRLARGPRRSRVPGPRPGAGPSRPCSSRRGRSYRRWRSPAGRQLARPWSTARHRGAGRAHRALIRAKARRKVDSSAAPRTAPSTASTPGPASAAHCPIAANDLDPAITAAIPTASSPASGCRRPRLLRGSGTWARRSSRYWLRAVGIGEDVIGGRVSLAAEDGERRNFHRSARTLPAARGHADHVNHRYRTAGHNFAGSLALTPPAQVTQPSRRRDRLIGR